MKRRKKSLGKRIGSGFNSATDRVEKFFKNLMGGIGKAFGFLGSLVVPKGLTKKVNRATKSSTKKMGKRVGKITDQVEKRFSKGASGVFSSFGYVFRIFVPKALLDWFGARSKAFGKALKTFFKRFSKGFESWAERYLPKWMVNAGKAFSIRSKRAWKTTSRFSSAWWQSRDFKALAWSVPAFVLLLPLLSSLVLAGIYDRNAKTTHYMRTMMDSLADKDYDKANLCQKKLSQLGYHKMETAEFNAALALAEEGDYLAAYEEMKRLAPLKDTSVEAVAAQLREEAAGEDIGTTGSESTGSTTGEATGEPGAESVAENAAESEPQGFAPAHLWIASNLLNMELPAKDDNERWRLMKAHADAALELDSRNKFAQYLQVKYLERTGQGADAIKSIIGLAGDYPEFNGELMEHYLNTRQMPLAKLRARSFIAYATGREPDRLFAIDWAYWAKAHALLGDEQQAADIAREGGRRYPSHPDIQKIASIAVMADLAVADPRGDGYVDLLCEAHEMDPTNVTVINRIASRLTYEPFEIETQIEEMKERNTISPQVFLVSGEIHLRGGRVAEAAQKFEQAIEVDDQFPDAYNNWAWLLANQPPKQLRAALVAIDQAIAIEDRSTFRETRGQIHFQLEDREAAIVDLEQALNGVLPERDRMNAHNTLSLIYDRLGKKELSQAHAARVTAPFRRGTRRE